MAKDTISSEVGGDLIAIGISKLAGKFISQLIQNTGAGKTGETTSRLRDMLFGMPKEIEEAFDLSITYALHQRLYGPVEERPRWMTIAERDLLYERLADLPGEKNNLYRLIKVQTWIGDWLGKDRNKDFLYVVHHTAQTLIDDARMSPAAWEDYISIHDLKAPLLSFDIKAKNLELEEKLKKQKAGSESFRDAMIGTGIAVAVLIIVIIGMIIRTSGGVQ